MCAYCLLVVLLHFPCTDGFPENNRHCLQASAWHTARSGLLLCRDEFLENNSGFQASTSHTAVIGATTLVRFSWCGFVLSHCFFLLHLLCRDGFPCNQQSLFFSLPRGTLLVMRAVCWYSSPWLLRYLRALSCGLDCVISLSVSVDGLLR